jgi:hypothetical protein
MVFESQKKKSTIQLEIILLIVVAYAVFSWAIGDVFSTWSAHVNPFLATFVYLLINPLNWYIMYGLTKDYKLVGFITSVLIVIIIDIISLPHSLTIKGVVNPNALSSYSDTALWNGLFYKIHPGILSTILLYIVLGIIVVFICLIIIKKPKKFVDIFKRAA